MDSAWEQEKLEAIAQGKMLAAGVSREVPQRPVHYYPGARAGRFVGQFYGT